MTKCDIGLRQAKRLCQMPHDKRLEFLSTGLPLILDNARRFWETSCQLKERPREAGVLQGYAEEEAAKILILVDAARCPSNLITSRMGRIASWFYSHLARLIYAEAVLWRPINVTQLREYVDECRKSHSLEGYFGEHIVSNLSIYTRESALYVDIGCVDVKGTLAWDAPNFDTGPFSPLMPPALQLSEAMYNLGVFTTEGLKATSEIWGQTEFKNSESGLEARSLLQQLVKRLIEEELPAPGATQEHADRVFRDWQLPMYDLDFTPISVPIEDLMQEQDDMLQAEMADFNGFP